MHSYSDRDLYTISKVVSGHIQSAGADPWAQTISGGGPPGRRQSAGADPPAVLSVCPLSQGERLYTMRELWYFF